MALALAWSKSMIAAVGLARLLKYWIAL